MASYSFLTTTIDMDCGGVGTFSTSDVEAMPSATSAAISFVHEYVHYIQSLGSVAGGRVVSEFIDIGVIAAAFLEGHIKAEDLGTRDAHPIPPFLPILSILKNHPDGAAHGLPIQTRHQSVIADAARVFSTSDVAYAGSEPPFAVVEHAIDEHMYFGFVTRRRTFRPFTVAWLAENMARGVDRRFMATLGEDVVHSWQDSVTEQEVYQGLSTLLGQLEYAHNIDARFAADIAIGMCGLALASWRPDLALSTMLARISRPATLGGLPRTVLHELRATVNNLLDANQFNAIIHHLQTGPAAAMARVDYVEIYEHLRGLQRVSNSVLHEPAFFVEGQTDWNKVTGWLRDFGLPRVLAFDGDVANVDGVPCRTLLGSLIDNTLRVLGA